MRGSRCRFPRLTKQAGHRGGEPWRIVPIIDDRLMRLLEGLAVLLFVGAMVLPRGRGGYRWAKWAAIVLFGLAFIYALGLVILWAIGR